MALVIKQLYPTMFFDYKVRNTKQNYTSNPFVNEQQTNQAESSSSIILDASLTINRVPTPTLSEISNMRKPALVQLYQSLLQQDGSNLALTILRSLLATFLSELLQLTLSWTHPVEEEIGIIELALVCACC